MSLRGRWWCGKWTMWERKMQGKKAAQSYMGGSAGQKNVAQKYGKKNAGKENAAWAQQVRGGKNARKPNTAENCRGRKCRKRKWGTKTRGWKCGKGKRGTRSTDAFSLFIVSLCRIFVSNHIFRRLITQWVCGVEMHSSAAGSHSSVLLSARPVSPCSPAPATTHNIIIIIFTPGGSVAEWLACRTKAQ